MNIKNLLKTFLPYLFPFSYNHNTNVFTLDAVLTLALSSLPPQQKIIVDKKAGIFLRHFTNGLQPPAHSYLSIYLFAGNAATWTG